MDPGDEKVGGPVAWKGTGRNDQRALLPPCSIPVLALHLRLLYTADGTLSPVLSVPESREVPAEVQVHKVPSLSKVPAPCRWVAWLKARGSSEGAGA